MILLRVPLSLSPLLFHYVPPRFRSYSIPLVSLCFRSFSFDSFVLWILSSLSFTPSSGLWLSVRFHRSLTLCVFSVSFSWSSVDSLLHFLFRASKLFFVEILEIHFSPLYALSSFFVYFEFSICWIFNKILRVLSFTFSRFFHIVLSLRYLL